MFGTSDEYHCVYDRFGCHWYVIVPRDIDDRAQRRELRRLRQANE